MTNLALQDVIESLANKTKRPSYEGPGGASRSPYGGSVILREGNRLDMIVHTVCRSQLNRVEGEPFFCEICDRAVGPDEIEEVDDSPSPFSG